MKEKPCWKGRTKLLREKATMAKLSERRQRWPSSEERTWPKPRCELNEYIPYLTICNLLIKQEILQKREKYHMFLKEKRI
jgi:hypothetical protein